MLEEEFQEWLAAFRLDPWDEWRGDLRSAIVAAIVDADRTGAKRTAPPVEYMPFERTARKRVKIDPVVERTQLTSFAALWNRR